MRSEPPTGDELTRLLVSMKRNVLEQVAQQQAATKRSSLTDRIIGLGLGVALLLGVGAGAALALGVIPPLWAPSATAPASTTNPTPTPTPTPTPVPAPTPASPPVEPVVAAGPPPSRYGLDCATLIDGSVVSGLFTTGVGPADPIVTASGIGIAIPRHTSVLSVGGTLCEWSNGAAYNDQYGSNSDYVGVTVSVVPRPAEGWSERAVRYGMPHDYSGCNDAACSASAAVGDAWVAVEAFAREPGAIDPSGWQPFVETVIEAVSAAGPAGELIVAERTGRPFPPDCDAIIPLDAARTITATPGVESHGPDGGGWSEWAEARVNADNVGCVWGLPDTDRSVADLRWVREGGWAYERMLRAGTAAPLELAGLGPDDAASIRCDANFGLGCAVDLRLDQDWFNVRANDEATAVALAEAMVAQLGT